MRQGGGDVFVAVRWSALRPSALRQLIPTIGARPPRLSRHYCVYDLPLDLSNEVMTSSTEVLMEAIAKLDGDGWSRDGVVHPVSRDRKNLLLAPLREEVLELLMGPRTPPNVESKAR